MALSAIPFSASAAPVPANLDESKVPPYVLPDPLVAADGTQVRDAATWRNLRRPELLELLAENVYGRTPGGRPAAMHAEMKAVDPAALGGQATRKEVTVWFAAGRAGPSLHLLVYQPNRAPGVAGPPWPVFLGLNFYGNHTVHSDPGIALPGAWVPNDLTHGVADNRAAEAGRGMDAGKWQVETVLARGYATATVYCGDLCPDRVTGLAASAATLFGGNPGSEERAGDAWGAVGVWAWGLSRALDWLETDPELDATRVAVHGHSRLGKAAVWAAAQDERFALVISNESGCGGAALSKRLYGETVGLINAQFPHWFARNFRRYDEREAELPVDQHELLALIAPRPLYVASAAGDQWADPRGEFLAAQAADPVYTLLGRPGLGVAAMPALNEPAGATIRYHLRSGPHDMTAYDWSCYLDFADRQLPAHRL
jgi:hypothetical protein